MFFEKTDCLASTYKSGSLRDKLPKKAIVGSQIAAHTLMETGNGPNEPNTINL